MSVEDRKAGYKAGLMASGEWLKLKVVGLIAKEHVVLRKEADLKDGQFLFAITKEELVILTNGELPK